MEVPIDLIQEILSYDPELLITGQTLNKRVRDRIQTEYYRRVCNKPLSEWELEKGGELYMGYVPKDRWELIFPLKYLPDFKNEENVRGIFIYHSFLGGFFYGRQYVKKEYSQILMPV